MQNLYDYKKFAILYVDDEEKSLKAFVRAFAEHFRILTAANAQDGFRLLEAHKDDIGLLMTDQRMPGEKGVQLLEKVRQLRPRIVRLLVTAYTDLDAAIAAVNTGAIYKYVSKPWDLGLLEATLRRGLEFFIVQRERDQLLREKMSVLHNMMITDRVVSWGILAAGLGRYLRDPQAAVRAFLDLAPPKLSQEGLGWEELRNPDYWKDFYSHVQGQIQQVAAMLRDLGVPADKPPAGLQDSVQLGTAVAHALATFQGRLAERQIRVVNDIPAVLPDLTVDRRQFARLCDLVLKAELASLPTGSQILLRAQALPADASRGAAVQWEIEDNGPGMPDHALRSLFDPFFVQSDGLKEFGTDLMACYFIVYHHRGSFAVKSRENQGTTLTLTLPTGPQPEDPSPAEAELLSKVLLNETLWERLLSEG